MHAFVYKSLTKPGSYLYLREKDAFELAPLTVREGLGRLQFVLDMQLSEGRKLAGADIAVVRTHLAQDGFHLQMASNPLDPLIAGGVGDG